MFAHLRRSWPVLIGVLLFLFSAQEAAAILQESSDVLPVQPAVPILEQTAPPVKRPPAWQASPTSAQPASPSREPFISLNQAAVLSPEAPGSTASRARPPAGKVIPIKTPAGPLIPSSPPDRLVIPAIGLDAPVVPADSKTISIAGKKFQQWKAPDRFAAGWHTTSAVPGQLGNTVLNGHNNIKGEVFKNLEQLSVGDEILVYTYEGVFSYEIANLMILPEKYEQLDTRMNNAQWILPSQDERLTLVTCWPYESNTHRLIIVARPIHWENIIRNLQ